MAELLRPFILARHFGHGRPPGIRISMIVIHTTESSERPGSAIDVAKWFSSNNAPLASPHYVVDPASIVGCVHEEDTAWAAPGANGPGIQIELCARAEQTKAQWDDDESREILENAAVLSSEICDWHGIPAMYLSSEALSCRDPLPRGITGHVDVTRAFHQSTHWDPGPAFPWDILLKRVRELVVARSSPNDEVSA